MPLYPLYKDFVKFLNTLPRKEDPWESYQRYYLQPHRDFLLAYWSHFKWMDLEQVKQRVRRIRGGDYCCLESLPGGQSPEQIVRETLRRCQQTVVTPTEPDLYLFVGFFSADAFLMPFKGKPVIGVGLERFKDLSSLEIILAHEYCHWLRRCKIGDQPPTLGNKLLSEGLAAVFSQLAFPDRPVHKYLFLSPERVSWCRENLPALLKLMQPELVSSRLTGLFFKKGTNEIPPRTGNYLGYRLITEYMTRCGRQDIEQLIQTENIRDLLRQTPEMT
jgi:hypothetical protein